MAALAYRDDKILARKLLSHPFFCLSAPTGKKSVVRVHYGEGVAIHIGPESCAGAREGIGEALTGERIGQAIREGWPTFCPRPRQLRNIAANTTAQKCRWRSANLHRCGRKQLRQRHKLLVRRPYGSYQITTVY